MVTLCYNCGCEMPEDDMGKKRVSQGGGSLTEGDFKHMADKWGMSVDDVKKNTYESLKGQLEK